MKIAVYMKFYVDTVDSYKCILSTMISCWES